MRTFVIQSLVVCSTLLVGGPGRADGPESEFLRLEGNIAPARTATVNASESGQIKDVLVEVGTVVRAGQVLARLDAISFELEYKRCQALAKRARAEIALAEAQLKTGDIAQLQAEAAVREATVDRDFLSRKSQRLRTLVNMGSVDESLADEAESQHKTAEARVQHLMAAVKEVQQRPLKERLAVTQADLALVLSQCDLAKLHLDATEIRAPADGTVLARRIEIGQDVWLNGQSAGLFTIADLSQLVVNANLAEKDYGRVRLGQICEVNCPALSGTVAFRGRITQIAPVISEKTRSGAVCVRLEVPKGDDRLHPGMFAEVRVRIKE